ncbi:MAG: hypothetical protein M3P04_01685 [Actinomycetota bacterium]|nr:hypothetical protein [Actinomycetota bacterium]
MGTFIIGAVPALADGNGSTEQQKERRSCAAPADPHYSKPSKSECRKKAGRYVAPSTDGKYSATHYTNNVKCGSKNEISPSNPSGVHVYGSGDPTTPSGGLGACSDGPVPVQGRAGISGSPSGLTVTADGDRDNNTPVTSDGTGWAVVSVGSGGASISCGKSYDTGGHGDADVPADGAQANCG